MLISKINDVSVECLISKEEMKELNATPESLLNGECESLDAILHTIINVAYDRFNIDLVGDIEKEELEFQVYEEENDHTIMVVSRVNKLSEEQTNDKELLSIDEEVDKIFNENHNSSTSFIFDTLNDVFEISNNISTTLKNSLYKINDKYELIIENKDKYTTEDYYNICLSLSEFSKINLNAIGRKAYLDEHATIIIKNNALKQLSKVCS